MASEAATVSEKLIPMVHVLRGKRVMLDSDLAKIYGVETKRLKEQFKRNREKFPDDFAFVLQPQELANLRSHFATSSLHGGAGHQPIKEGTVRYRTRKRI